MSAKRITKSRRPFGSTQKGYLLLSVMLLITLMLIVLATALPRIAQQIKRQKEEELVHRGREYASAIKKFYHKNGTYPLSLDQLEDTNHIRFLRHRYKDPMTSKGEWKLIHVGEAQITLTGLSGPGGQQGPGQMGTLTTSMPGAQAPGTQPGGFGGQPGMSSGLNSSAPTMPGGLNAGGLNAGGLNAGGLTPGGTAGSTPAGGGGQLGTLNTQGFGTGFGSNAGGGPIIGVASTSTNRSIKEFNGANEYDQWLFVYDPRLEMGPGGGGITVASPRGSGSGSGTTSGAVPAGVVSAPPPNQPGPGGATPTPSGQPTPQGQPTPTPQNIPQ